MDLSEFEKVQKTDWMITDGDYCQLRRTDALAISGIFELTQINCYPGYLRKPPHQDQKYYKVAHGRIYASDYSEKEIQGMLRTYGYNSLDDFVEQTSPEWDVVYKEDGTIDRENSPSYIVDFGLIAEMFFETEVMEYELPEEYDSWNEAVAAIESITGCNLNFLKEKDKDSLDQRLQDAQQRSNDQTAETASTPEKER